MAKDRTLFDAPGVSFRNGVLSINRSIEIDELANGSWVATQGSQSYTLTPSQVDSIGTIDVARNAVLDLNARALTNENVVLTGAGRLNISEVVFTEADEAANSRFEPNANLDTFISGLIGPFGRNMDYAINHLTVGGDQAGAIKLVWDFLDDAYGAANDYYRTELNEAFIRLGVEYAQYLKAGGAPFTDVVAKYTPDDADSNTTPERLQSMHDNLLGNFNAVDFASRFPGAAGDALRAYIESAGVSDLLARPAYSGNEGAPNNALPWDVQNGYLGAQDGDHRGRGHDKDGDGIDDHENTTGRGHALDGGQLHAKDYTRSFADIDPTGTKGGAGTEMLVGTGIPEDNFVLFTNHELDFELGLKLHLRGGSQADLIPTIDGDGTAHYLAPSGLAAPSRAAWNFDFSVNTGIEGSTQTLDAFDFRIVIVSGDGERAVFELEHLGPGVTPWLHSSGSGFTDDDGLNPQVSQNSVNFGFAFMKAIFGEDYNDAGEHYDIWLQAFDGNKLVGEVHNSIDII
jgi:hypothetical protein